MDLFEYAKLQNKKEEPAKPKAPKSYTVTQLSQSIKKAIDAKFPAQKIFLQGQLSNFKGRHQSGHMYFRVKDDNAVINAVFFRQYNQSIDFDLEEGMDIVVSGHVDVWLKGGNYQFIVEYIEPAGVGKLHLKFEKLKKKLQQKGFFEDRHKKNIVEFPKKIGLITSKTGSVLRDMVYVLKKRYPLVKVYLFSVQVQGDRAKFDIVKALNWFNEKSDVDTLIVARGGGSMEDLWAFNEEMLAEAIFKSNIPVINAVGHQTDFTISDWVADLRAATPSQAAELAVPDTVYLMDALKQMLLELKTCIDVFFERKAEKLKHLKSSKALKDPKYALLQKQQYLDYLNERIRHKYKNLIPTYKVALMHVCSRLKQNIKAQSKLLNIECVNLIEKLNLMNPLNVLQRGFAIVQNQNKQVIDSFDQIKKDDRINVKIKKGSIECKVLKTHKDMQ